MASFRSRWHSHRRRPAAHDGYAPHPLLERERPARLRAKGFDDCSGARARDVRRRAGGARASEPTSPRRAATPQGWHAHCSRPRNGRAIAAWRLYARRPRETVGPPSPARFDSEGRFQLARFGRLVVATLLPERQRQGPRQLAHAVQARVLRGACSNARAGARGRRARARVGDFNTAHEPIDLARPRDNARRAASCRTSAALTRWLDAGWVDTFRAFEPAARPLHVVEPALRRARARTSAGGSTTCSRRRRRCASDSAAPSSSATCAAAITPGGRRRGSGDLRGLRRGLSRSSLWRVPSEVSREARLREKSRWRSSTSRRRRSGHPAWRPRAGFRAAGRRRQARAAVRAPRQVGRSCTSTRRTTRPAARFEACAFRDQYEDFVDAGADVIGVSSGLERCFPPRGFAKAPIGFRSRCSRIADGAVRKLYGSGRRWGSCPAA